MSLAATGSLLPSGQFNLRIPAFLLAMLLIVSRAEAQADLTALARGAGEDFQPISSEEIEAARQLVRSKATALEQALASKPENAAAWKTYLNWQGISGILAADGSPDLAAAQQTLRHLTQNEEGLEMPIFKDLARALRVYLAKALIYNVDDQQAAYNRQLELLAANLGGAIRGEFRATYEVERRVDFLTNLGQSPELITAIRTQLAKPNIFVTASEETLNESLARPVDRISPVNDYILGARIHGDGRTTGNVNVSFLPSNSGAKLLFTMTGTTHANTLGTRDPVLIYSRSTTSFTASKVVVLSDDSFGFQPAYANASTNSRTLRICKQGGGLGSNLVENIARRRVEEQRTEADCIASQHAEDRIAGELDAELANRIRDARHRYDDQFRTPLVRRNAELEVVSFRTTDQELQVETLQADQGELGAGGPPPPAETGFDVTARVHHSAANNVLDLVLAGATLSQQGPNDDPKLDKELPSWFRRIAKKRLVEEAPKPSDNFKPWSLQFRATRPVSVQVEPGRLTIAVHVARLTAGADSYDGWDLIAKYAPTETQDGWKLLRQGDIEVLPTNFDPGSDNRLSSRQIALRSNLSEEINDDGGALPEEIDLKPIRFDRETDSGRQLYLKSLATTDGWISFGWTAE